MSRRGPHRQQIVRRVKCQHELAVFEIAHFPALRWAMTRISLTPSASLHPCFARVMLSTSRRTRGKREAFCFPTLRVLWRRRPDEADVYAIGQYWHEWYEARELAR
jgi:hypothetical protein